MIDYEALKPINTKEKVDQLIEALLLEHCRFSEAQINAVNQNISKLKMQVYFKECARAKRQTLPLFELEPLARPNSEETTSGDPPKRSKETGRSSIHVSSIDVYSSAISAKKRHAQSRPASHRQKESACSNTYRKTKKLSGWGPQKTAKPYDSTYGHSYGGYTSSNWDDITFVSKWSIASGGLNKRR